MISLGLAALLAGAAGPLSIDANAITAPVAISARVGDRVVVEGTFHSILDGTDIDAAHVRDAYLGSAEPSVRPHGLIDWERGGLRLVERDWEHHREVAVVAEARAPACAAAGIFGPCIVPRIDVLAHERLVPRSEFATSLRGGLQVSTRRPIAALSWLKVASITSIAGACLFLLGWSALSLRRRNEEWRRIAREARLLSREAGSLPNGPVVLNHVETLMVAARRTMAMIQRVDHEARRATRPVRNALGARRRALMAELRRTAEQLSAVRLRLALGGEVDQVDAALEALSSEVAIGEAALAEANLSTGL
jgi:hypothetical protein